MEVKLADKYGFCFGVKRAVNFLEETIEEGIEAHTLGPIVHNKQLVEKLSEGGIEPVEDLSEAEKENIILRAHGIPPQKQREIEESEKFNILKDGTCPLVKEAQKHAEKLDKEGYKVVIIGERGHPEVRGLKSYGNAGVVLESEKEVENLDDDLSKIGVVLQTTQSEERVSNVISKLVHKVDKLKVYNTRCTATRDRQKAAIELSNKVDGIVVVGDYHSANTTRLVEVCSKHAPTHHIEVADELKKEWFKGMDTIGITAGASTPDYLIEEVKERLEQM